jgi:hypothetical protein
MDDSKITESLLYNYFYSCELERYEQIKEMLGKKILILSGQTATHI